MDYLLETKGVCKQFGPRRAVRNLSFSLAPGEILGVIGPNGAGKTTLLNLLTGFYPPDKGDILLHGSSILGKGPDRIARMGMVRTFQLTRIFSRLTVLENLMVAAATSGLGKKHALERCKDILKLLHLEPVSANKGEEISGGQARLLELGTCLVAEPEILLLDEPFAAVHPHLKEILVSAILEQNAMGRSFIIVSHDIPVLSMVCPRAMVLNAGEYIAGGELETLLEDSDLMSTYLGGVPLDAAPCH